MNNRKKFNVWFLIVLICLIFIGVFNFVVDPFQQYRVKTYYPIKYETERYKNAGFIKHIKHDSIILGTSMSQNFIMKEVEELLGYDKVLKVTLSGASAKEQSMILNFEIENNKKLKNVLWGVDYFSFIGYPDRLFHGQGSFPEYLYDNRVLNDYKYLFSKDVTVKSFKLSRDIISGKYYKNKELFDYNRMYEWQGKEEKSFTLKNVMKDWSQRRKEKIQGEDFFFMRHSFEVNFLEILKKNPHINFTLFFPPYSILEYCNLEEKELFTDMIQFKQFIYERLNLLKNVKIYDFQVNNTIIMNLENYKDMRHYSQDVNSWMLEQIQSNKYQLTDENIILNKTLLKKYIKKCKFE